MSAYEFMNEGSLRSYQSSKSLPTAREAWPCGVSAWSAAAAALGVVRVGSRGLTLQGLLSPPIAAAVAFGFSPLWLVLR